MNAQNRYCCRCQRTTRFTISGATFTCTSCGVRVEVSAGPHAPPPRRQASGE
ncbi:MAG: hypothetical protein ACK4N5_12495 [Myxococcales bacterium]